MPLGEAAARKVADRLARLSVPPEEYAALRRRQRVAVAPDLAPGRRDPLRAARRASIPRTRRRSWRPGRASRSTSAKLDADMRRIYGTGDFEHVNYRIARGDEAPA